MIYCQYCGYKIVVRTVKCPFCFHELPDSEVAPTSNNPIQSVDVEKKEFEVRHEAAEIKLYGDQETAINLMLDPGVLCAFITGQTGTGKSTLLEFYRSEATKRGVKFVILAPTGVAAINVRGQTIHSFFKFPPKFIPSKDYGVGIKIDDTVIRRRSGIGSEIYRKLDVVVLDEVSMVRADTIDAIDAFLRLNGKDKKKPFGGVKMVFLGDLYQLAPVISDSSSGEGEHIQKCYPDGSFFFHAQAFRSVETFSGLELRSQMRQADDNLFAAILSRIRRNHATEDDLQIINSRVTNRDEIPDNAVWLTGRTKIADIINSKKLSQLSGDTFISEAEVTGQFQKSEDKQLPTSRELKLKIGARVMLLANSSGYVNGDLATVMKVVTNEEEDEVSVVVTLDRTKRQAIVLPHTWDKTEYILDKETGKIRQLVVGTFMQFPMRLGYAMTIHKGQGKTLSSVAVDLGGGAFAHGQSYVALSRCRKISDLYLLSPINPQDIIMDESIEAVYDLFAASSGAMDPINLSEAIKAPSVIIRKLDTSSLRIRREHLDPVSIQEIVVEDMAECRLCGREFVVGDGNSDICDKCESEPS